MMQPSITLSNFDRLAKAVMERHRLGYTDAQQVLSRLRLALVVGQDIRESRALQASVLTAINTGKRAFRGGVTLSGAVDVPLLLQWPTGKTFESVAEGLGATLTHTPVQTEHVVSFANTSENATGGLRVVCDGWRGGIVPCGDATRLDGGPDFELGGILAGAIAVGHTFMHAAGITSRDIVTPSGMSLWRPDLPWVSNDACGPAIEMLPAKIWLLGLGHLGQAYAWTIGLLGCPSFNAIKLYLQDYDISESANWSAGLLCDESNIGELKTRMTSRWLERRGFDTRIVERRFDENTRRAFDEPRIALCGFDNAESRRLLEAAGYDLVIDAALGGDANRFDRIVVRTFPGASQKATDIFSVSTRGEQSSLTADAFGLEAETCGILFHDLAGTAVSSAFAGAAASAFAIAELMKALHGGHRCEFLTLYLRDLQQPAVALLDEDYQLRVARNGFVLCPEGLKGQRPQ